MLKSGQLVSRFSSDGEASLFDHPRPEAVDLTGRAAFQPFTVQDGNVNEKENIAAAGDGER